jgi:RNA polymerase sigma-70 factor (ECF subfamily)
MTTTDHNYITQIANGNTQAFAHLVNKYQHMVFTIALKVMGNREEAEDVAQEAFVKCYQSLSKFKGDAKFSTWLYRITYNHCLDKVKSNKRKGYSIQVDEVYDLQSDAENTYTIIESKEQQEVLQKAIKKLPEADQLLITLYYFEELSIKEIAQIVAIKENNIKIKLHRIRAKLHDILQPAKSFLNEKSYE